MEYRDKPFFIIKNNFQKSGITRIYFNNILTGEILKEISEIVTSDSDYTVSYVDNEYSDEFLEKGYNKGRLAILQYHDVVNFISFSDQNADGRNSSIQSVPTAFNRFYSNPYEKKKLWFYFLPCNGNNQTNYLVFMYRLMMTAGFEFINIPIRLQPQLNSFLTIEDIILARKENGERNPSNNSTYILKDSDNSYEIYGKTYGANKYDTSLICYAVSKLAQRNGSEIVLYEYDEKNLRELPKPSLKVIKSMGIKVVNIDSNLEREELERDSYNGLRSPLFTEHLLDHLGERHCVFCECTISEIIQAAHLWPVASIKRLNNITIEQKLGFSTNGANGLWMCQNHHKLFDLNIFTLTEQGEVIIRGNLNEDQKNYVQSITSVSRLPEEIITQDYVFFIRKRYE